MSSGSSSNVKPLYCNKCNESGFFHSNQDVGNWPCVDKRGNIEAFDPKYRVPHWYVCPASERGRDNRQRLDAKKTSSATSVTFRGNPLVPPSTTIGNTSNDDIMIQAIRVDLAEVKATLATILERLDALAYPEPKEPEYP